MEINKIPSVRGVVACIVFVVEFLGFSKFLWYAHRRFMTSNSEILSP